jgi:hypothetical protein
MRDPARPRPGPVRRSRTIRGTGAGADQPRARADAGRCRGACAVAGRGGASVWRSLAASETVGCSACPPALVGGGPVPSAPASGSACWLRRCSASSGGGRSERACSRRRCWPRPWLPPAGVERVTGIEPASRAWKAVSGRGPTSVAMPNAQVRADNPGAVGDCWVTADVSGPPSSLSGSGPDAATAGRAQAPHAERPVELSPHSPGSGAHDAARMKE